MKLNELNQNQAVAIKAIVRTYNAIIGGAENALLDYDETDDEYIEAEKLLNNPKELTNLIYEDLMANEGSTYAKEIHFCGTEWLKERIARRLKKEGYYPDYQKRPEYDLRAKQ